MTTVSIVGGSGYAGGEYNADKQLYEVRQKVAHTWVEVYFPTYGWQRFEPTPASYTNVPERAEAPSAEGENAQGAGVNGADALRNNQANLAELERLLLEREGAQSDPARVRQLIAEQEARQFRATWVRRGILGGSVLILGLIGLFWLRRPYGVGPAAIAYGRALWFARWSGLGPKPSATPQEFALQLAEHIPTQRQPLNDIATAYTRERYSDTKRVQPDVVNSAWKQVRWPLVGTLLTRWIGLGRTPKQEGTRSRAQRRRR